jgi:hypothetical protein
MCRKAACAACARPTWVGCGRHVEAALHDVPAAERCPAAAAEPGAGGAREGDAYPLAAACLRVQRVPNDGDCLFSAVAFCELGDSGRAPLLRAAAVDAVLAAPERFPESALGAPRGEYAARMRAPGEWGGELELAVLAAARKIDIAVAALPEAPGATLRLYPVAEAAAAAAAAEVAAAPARRCYLIYTGTHYDAVRRFDGAGPALFASADADESVRRLADALRAAAAKPKTWVRCSVADGGCGAVVEARDFEEHCSAVAHGEDFMMMAEPAEAPLAAAP